MKNYNTNNALQKHKMSDKIKWVIAFSLILLIIVGMVGISVYLFEDKDEKAEEYSNSVVERQYAFVGGNRSLNLSSYEEYFMNKKMLAGEDIVITVKFDFVPENAKIEITPIYSGSATDEGYTAVFDEDTSLFTVTITPEYGGVSGWRLNDSVNDVTINLYLVEIE